MTALSKIIEDARPCRSCWYDVAEMCSQHHNQCIRLKAFKKLVALAKQAEKGKK